MIRFVLGAALLSQVFSSQVVATSSEQPIKLAAASTSLQTGLLSRLLQEFLRTHPGIDIDLQSVGSLQALEAAEQKLVDIVISHHPVEEKGLVESGVAARVTQLAHSRFAVFGPPDDELQLSNKNSINDVLKILAEEEVEFIVPSPRGGTYAKIEDLWTWVGINPAWLGYEYTTVSSQSVFEQAAEFGKYTIAESGLYYRNKSRYQDRLVPLYENDLALRNTYSVMLVDRGKDLHPDAKALFDYMVSPQGQELLLKAAREIFKADIIIPAAAYDPGLRIESERKQHEKEKRNLQTMIGLVILASILGIMAMLFYIRLQGKEQQRIKAFHDSELKQAELDNARYQNEMKSRFVSNVTHDLKTPIHAIQGYTDLVATSLGGSITDKQSSYINTVQQCSQRMSNLIDDILDISTLEQDNNTFEFNVTDLNGLIVSALEEVDIICQQKNISTSYQPGKETISTQSDRGRLTQAIINILSNAVRFTPEDGNIEVKSRINEGDKVIITIRDTGPGIPDQDIEHIFDAFFQASNTSRDQGTGLGLSICAKIIARHNGSIKASNHPDGGAIFTIRLPVDQPA